MTIDSYAPPSFLRASFGRLCPRCGQAGLFAGYLKLRERCERCGLALAEQDSGDGPAVFVMLILGFLVVGLAIGTEIMFAPPYWVHVAVWPPVITGLALAMLVPLKAGFVWLNYRHRSSAGPSDGDG